MHVQTTHTTPEHTQGMVITAQTDLVPTDSKVRPIEKALYWSYHYFVGVVVIK